MNITEVVEEIIDIFHSSEVSKTTISFVELKETLKQFEQLAKAAAWNECEREILRNPPSYLFKSNGQMVKYGSINPYEVKKDQREGVNRE